MCYVFEYVSFFFFLGVNFGSENFGSWIFENLILLVLDVFGILVFLVCVFKGYVYYIFYLEDNVKYI